MTASARHEVVCKTGSFDSSFGSSSVAGNGEDIGNDAEPDDTDTDADGDEAASRASAHGFDLTGISNAIADEVDFAGLLSALQREHGITLKRIIGLGTASVIFEAVAHYPENHGTEHQEYETVAIKVIDHQLVRLYSLLSAPLLSARRLSSRPLPRLLCLL